MKKLILIVLFIVLSCQSKLNIKTHEQIEHEIYIKLYNRIELQKQSYYIMKYYSVQYYYSDFTKYKWENKFWYFNNIQNRKTNIFFQK